MIAVAYDEERACSWASRTTATENTPHSLSRRTRALGHRLRASRVPGRPWIPVSSGRQHPAEHPRRERRPEHHSSPKAISRKQSRPPGDRQDYNHLSPSQGLLGNCDAGRRKMEEEQPRTQERALRELTTAHQGGRFLWCTGSGTPARTGHPWSSVPRQPDGTSRPARHLPGCRLGTHGHSSLVAPPSQPQLTQNQLARRGRASSGWV